VLPRALTFACAVALACAAAPGCTCQCGVVGGGESDGTVVGLDGGGGGPDAAAGSREDPLAVCARWTGDRGTLTEGTWSGDVATCTAGEVSADGHDSALLLMNLYRWLARLPEVTDEASRNADAQACALMQHANGMLSHTPPPTWACYTASGANGAGTANIAAGPGVIAMDMYMSDFGNPTTIGHRRWILANSTGPVGLGSTNSYSCLVILTGTGNAGEPWMAWPPPGPFPAEAAAMVAMTGWTIQSDSIDVGAGTATITVAGVVQPVTQVVLAGGYGSAYAINLIPMGWSAQPGTTYHVEVTGITPTIAYDVDIVDCP
jgi:hypothetical protein